MTNPDFCPEVVEDSSSVSTAYIPVPLLVALFCVRCADPSTRAARSRAQGSFAGQKPHNSFVEHLRGCHQLAVQVKFRCRLCADVFSGLRQANTHVAKRHSAASVAQLQSSPPPQQTFVCTDCGSVHVSQVGLRSHLKGCRGSRSTNTSARASASALAQCSRTPAPLSPPAAPASPAHTPAPPTPAPSTISGADAAQTRSPQRAVSPILELTASQLLGELAQDVETLSLPASPSAGALSPHEDLGVAVPRGTWPEPLVVEARSPPSTLPASVPLPVSASSELSPERPAGSR